MNATRDPSRVRARFKQDELFLMFLNEHYSITETTEKTKKHHRYFWYIDVFQREVVNKLSSSQNKDAAIEVHKISKIKFYYFNYKIVA